MSQLAHLMCERCLLRLRPEDDEADWVTDSHAGRLCCWCGKKVEYGTILHRHPDAVPCGGRKGIHREPKECVGR